MVLEIPVCIKTVRPVIYDRANGEGVDGSIRELFWTWYNVRAVSVALFTVERGFFFTVKIDNIQKLINLSRAQIEVCWKCVDYFGWWPMTTTSSLA
jgi:hypothetical protein